MILAPNRANPPRYRERDIQGQGDYDGDITGYFDTWDLGKTVQTSHRSTAINCRGYEYMYDTVGNKGKWNDVQHARWTVEYSPNDQDYVSCAPGCTSGLDNAYMKTLNYGYMPQPMNSIQGIISHPKSQAALQKVLQDWHDSLYNMNNALLPDVSIILMEDVPRLTGSLEVIISLMTRIMKVVKLIQDLDVKVSKFEHQKNFTQAIIAQREMRAYGKLYLGYEFALKQNCATATDLIAGVSRAQAHLCKGRETTSQRAFAGFETHTSGDLCPGWDNRGRSGTISESVRIQYVITSEASINVRGSNLERALAKSMAKVGVLPQLASIWEATPYSWLIDYVFRTGLLLRYVERANSIGFSDVDVFRTAFSVQIERDTECVSKHYPSPAKTLQHYEFYERCIGADLNFPAILQWVKLPHGSQWAKAAAFFFTQFK